MDERICMFFGSIFFVLLKFSKASDAITLSRSLRDENSSTLVSAGGSFELGFFTPGSSSNRYVGIWYKNIPVKTVVWVANRQSPINDSSGTLMIDSTGNLVLVGWNKTVFWSTNSTNQAQTPVVELLDSGNLVLRDTEDGNAENYLWQSFDYPTDTLLPGMKNGINLRTGLDRRIVSWKSWDDPSPGYFYRDVLPHNYPDTAYLKGSSIFFRTGPWNGVTFSGTPPLRPNSIFTLAFVNDGEEIYYTYYLKTKSVMTRLVMNQTNNRQERFTWNNDNQSWMIYSIWPADYCDTYAVCGAYGICAITNSPLCRCLQGFKPKLPEKWNSTDWTDGCVLNKPLDCHGDGFLKSRGLKLPDTTYSWVNKSMDMKQCRAKCLENCSCSAYSNFDVRNGGSGCAIWFYDLFDMKQLPSEAQELYIQDLYVRMSASQLAEFGNAKAVPSNEVMAITVAVIVVFTAILVAGYYLYRAKIRVKENKAEFDSKDDDNKDNLELPLFDFSTISNATDEFAPRNKLGEGGFGSVYEGALSDGQEIAVKRLSRNSGQGVEEFKNEVILIAKLQHRNLVKLLGCCIQGEERLLIYEFMPNKSLDTFIFDKRRAKLLDWSKRFNIICGIARGLLYLHQDSRLRIIHRDLKASNVLLDDEMNPKISDFGMARIFGGDQIEGNTKRVVGTYGYMAPEYATDGLFSIKSDVFSFGIVMLEIISGKKSRGFYHPNYSINLIGYAWRLWKEGNSSELIDSILRESSDLEEVNRCIHISLLCVQHHVEDRPSMSSVILMLSTENCTLPQPKEPGFFKHKISSGVDSSSGKIESTSTGEISITTLEPR